MKNVILAAAALLGLASAGMAQVPNYVPTNGLVGWWPFNGNANDESGNGHNGTVNAAVLSTDRFGNQGKAYSFNGLSSYIACSNPDFSTSNIMTLSFWVIISNTNSSLAQYLVSKGVDCAGGFYFGYINSPPAFYGGFSCGSANTVGDAQSIGQPAPQTTWSHICYVFDGSEMKFYYNGLLVDTQSNAVGNLGNTNTLLFGKHDLSGFDYFLNGKLDDIVLYNRVLTFQEISNLFNAFSCTNNTAIAPQINSLSTGSTATFTATTSDPNPSYIWQTDFGLGFQNLQNTGQYAGVNTDSLTVSNLQLRNHQQAFRVITTSGNCVDTSAVAAINLSDTCLISQFETVTTDTIQIVVTGINPPDYLNTLKIYPNPATQGTDLKMDFGDFGTMLGYKLRVENAQGQQVFQTNIDHENDSFNIGTSGIYLVRILDPQGNTKLTRKILIQ